MAVASKNAAYFNKTKGVMLADRARIADGFFDRLVGLLMTENFVAGDGLFIVPCSQIHMFGMKYAIDVVFVDKQGLVVGLVESISPGQMSKLFSKAHACLELPSGVIRDTGTSLGDQIETRPIP